MNEIKQDIRLNFLSILTQDFTISVYVSPYNKEDFESITDIHKLRCKFPFEGNKYSDCTVVYELRDGFTRFNVSNSTNQILTKNYLMWKLYQKLKTSMDMGVQTDRGFRRRINMTTRIHDIGNEVIWIEPYYLKATSKWGFLFGYHFQVNDSKLYDRRTQILSLSLGNDGRENKNFYIDYYNKIMSFINNQFKQQFPFQLDEETTTMLDISESFESLSVESLDPKKYIFNNENIGNSQFQGMLQYGPYANISSNSILFFLFQEQDKSLSHDLYFALFGKTFSTFSGMKSMFRYDMNKDNIRGIPIKDYSEQSILEAIIQIKEQANGRNALPLILAPVSKQDNDLEWNDSYFRIKHLFLQNNMPTQFVSKKRIIGKDGLKWSIANIGLAVFSKLGGKPWKLKPKNHDCLIIGIGQAHQIVDSVVKRYYAYSILSDSSGLYDSIVVLSSNEDKDKYLDGLTDKIKEIINKRSSYKTYVLHTPFKIRYDELEAIEKAFIGITDKVFIVMKFNDKSKFFGFDMANNSRVPYESSLIKLSENEVLMWFEGLQYQNPSVNRRYPHPMNIELIYPRNGKADINSFLQDAINISGANWRGFNAKSMPVSVYYSKLIAEYISEFQRLKLNELNIEELPPWFL